jgi:hypothetical protein
VIPLAALIVVTNADYRACVKTGPCKPAAFEDPRSAATVKPENIAAYKKVSAGDQPAVGVSWNDADDYCRWAGKRLASLKDFGPGAHAKNAVWLADADGSKRMILEGSSQRAEDPWARAPWLSFRCAE